MDRSVLLRLCDQHLPAACDPSSRHATSFLLVMLAALAMATAGCPSFQKPTLSVLGAKVKQADFNGATIDVDVELANDNAVPLFTDRLAFQGFIEKKPLVTGELNKRVSVDAHGKTKVTVPLRFVYRELGEAAAAMKDQARWRYNITGEVGFAPIKEAGTFLVPFTTDGDLPAPRLPTLRAENPRLERPTLMSLTVAVDVEVKNPNAFSVPAGVLEGDLVLGGQKTRVSLRLPSTAAEKTQKVTLRQQVDLTKIARVGVDVAAGKAVPATLDVAAVFGERRQPLRASITLRR